jgi:glycosyltransferase involved in cell wall biosynthesis
MKERKNSPEWLSRGDCQASGTMVGYGLKETCTFSSSSGYREGFRKPRIALFSGNYNYLRDGANQALNRLVSHLEQKLDASVRVYSPTVTEPAFEPTGDLVSVPSIGIPGRSEYRLALGLARGVRADLEQFDPDIVHVSAPDLLGNAVRRWAHSQSIPVIASVHTLFESYFSYYRLGWAEKLATRYLTHFYANSDFVLVPTWSLQDQLSAACGHARVRLWGRGVDHELFAPTRRDHAWRSVHGYQKDELVVLFFSRLVLEKGIEVFAQVVRKLRNAGHQVRPLVVGDGPGREQMEKDLPAAVFTGHLEGENLARAIASADIMIMPSVNEALGNVVLEAMASGVVVVCADTPSARNLVAHGETGFLCASIGADAYVSTAIELLGKPARRVAIGVAARRASLTHRWDTVLENVLAVYREALALSEKRTCSQPFQRRQIAKPTGSDHFEERIDRKCPRAL